jgi:gamma-glutamyltranspeptidase/glutathione hydrolase
MIRSRVLVTKQTPLARRGMTAAEHRHGARVGAQILEAGGNAVDAAIATAFAMTVVEPFMSTLAGSGTMLVHLARQRETLCIDFNGVAPLRAHDGMYKVIGGVSTALFPWARVEDEANVFGYRSVAVPGSVAGLTLALERYGTMALADVMRPAIELARDGFEPDWYLSLHHAKFIEELMAFPETARVYLRNGHSVYRPASMQPGDHVRYPDLADSLSLIARDGAAAFYRGPIARALCDDMAAHGGIITREDLAAYQPQVHPALMGRYRGLDLAFSPGPTGGVTALESLNILEQFASSRVGWDSAEGLHLRASAIGRAFMDRFEHLGDPSFVKAPWDELVSKEYAREVAAQIRSGKPRRPSSSKKPGPSPDCTTHVSVIDGQRNMVALTHTAVSLWGSRVVVPGTGILLNNGMIWFDPESGKNNSVAAGKRALVNMVPALAFLKGKPHLALGAPGGRTIISAIPQVIANLADRPRMSAQSAIDAPRLHTEGGEVLVSHRADAAAVAGLARRGHKVVVKEETYSTLNFARPVAVRVTPKGLEAGAESYSAAAAAGI